MGRLSRKPPVSELIRALEDSLGNVSNAAKSLGYSHTSFYDWIKKDKTGKLEKAMCKGNNKLVDLAEGVIEKKLLNNDGEMAKFVMRYRGRDRGWFMHQTTEGKIEGELGINAKIEGDVNVVVHTRIINSREELDNIPKMKIAEPEPEKKSDIALMFGGE
jgi:hypothetical protein